MSMFISCDWGTSAFRLRVIGIAGGPGSTESNGGGSPTAVIAAVSTGEGIAATHAAWEASGLAATERVAFYREVLEKAIGELASRVPARNGEAASELQGVPVVVSGMASSSIGMLELPYHPLPFDVSGVGLLPATLPPTSASPRILYLLPGVRSADDVMRGEETQLVGCGANPPGERVFVFPGTHSKHVIVRNGRAVDLKTYMTGELFTLLARQSILAGSVAAPAAGAAVARDGPATMAARDSLVSGPASSGAAGLPAAFFAGVAAARESGLLHNAFLTRTNHLFDTYSKEDNYHFLSGLLIGEELVELLGPRRENGAAIASRQFRPLTLVASSPLREAYTAALARLGVGQPTVIDADQALVAGHCAIIARFGATIAL